MVQIKVLFSLLFFSTLVLSAKSQDRLLPNGQDTIPILNLPEPNEGIDAGRSSIKPPQQIEASDGLYDDRIRITWSTPYPKAWYKLFRGTSVSKRNMQPVSNGWQKSNWLIDANVEPGIIYYYRVMTATNSRDVSPLSRFDTGYAQITTQIAQPNLSATTKMLDISVIQTNADTVHAGDTLHLFYMLTNPVSQNLENVQLVFSLQQAGQNYYLSDHWFITLNKSTTLREYQLLALPNTIRAGTYQLNLEALMKDQFIGKTTYSIFIR